MQRTGFLVALVFSFPTLLFAQSSSFHEAFQVGVLGDYTSNMYPADFTKLVGSTCCCQATFRAGTGEGFRAGAFVRIPVTNAFSVDAAVTYTLQNGRFTGDVPAVFRLIDTTTVAGLFRQTLAASIRTISFEPQMNYHFADAFRLSFGMQIFYVLKDTCLQKERIIEPAEGYVFSSGGRERTVYSGVIPQMRKYLASVSIGLGYDFTLGFIVPLIISPEISYSFGLMNIIQGIDWKINALRAGIRVSVPFGGERTQ